MFSLYNPSKNQIIVVIINLLFIKKILAVLNIKIVLNREKSKHSVDFKGCSYLI